MAEEDAFLVSLLMFDFVSWAGMTSVVAGLPREELEGFCGSVSGNGIEISKVF